MLQEKKIWSQNKWFWDENFKHHDFGFKHHDLASKFLQIKEFEDFSLVKFGEESGVNSET